MSEINKTEQWKLDGKCSLCRRKNYCSKPCKKANQAKQAFIKSAIRDIMDDATDGNYSRIMNMSEFGKTYL